MCLGRTNTRHGDSIDIAFAGSSGAKMHTVYDAAYVALAEMTAVDLLTADTQLAMAPGIRCAVEVR